MKTLSLNLIRNFLLLILLSVTADRAVAQTPVSGNPGLVSIRYAGIQNDHLLFYVQVSNDSKERLRFMITDENRNILFEESFTGSVFEKKILLVKTDMKNVGFEVVGKNFNYSRQFAISTKTVEEVTVKEAK